MERAQAPHPIHVIMSGAMKKVIAFLAAAAMISLCGWLGGAHPGRQRIKAEFENRNTTVVVHCGPITKHESAIPENVPPPQTDMQRVRNAFKVADDLDGYITVIGRCNWAGD